MNRISILDIPIDNISFNDLKEKIVSAIKTDQKLFISTVNASFIYKSLHNKEFFDILKNDTNINTADGVSVQLSAEYLSNCKKYKLSLFKLILGIKLGIIDFFILNKKFKVIPNRITGIEITKYLLSYCNKNEKRILIIHKEDSLLSTKELEDYLNTKYSNITYKIVNRDSYLSMTGDFDVYFCTLGEFYQEKLLNDLQKNRKSSVFIGVGSSFDVLTNKIVSVNNKYSQRGLEWLIRLITRPKRFNKIFRSVVLFPYAVFKSSL